MNFTQGKGRSAQDAAHNFLKLIVARVVEKQLLRHASWITSAVDPILAELTKNFFMFVNDKAPHKWPVQANNAIVLRLRQI